MLERGQCSECGGPLISIHEVSELGGRCQRCFQKTVMNSFDNFDLLENESSEEDVTIKTTNDAIEWLQTTHSPVEIRNRIDKETDGIEASFWYCTVFDDHPCMSDCFRRILREAENGNSTCLLCDEIEPFFVDFALEWQQEELKEIITEVDVKELSKFTYDPSKTEDRKLFQSLCKRSCIFENGKCGLSKNTSCITMCMEFWNEYGSLLFKVYDRFWCDRALTNGWSQRPMIKHALESRKTSVSTTSTTTSTKPTFTFYEVE